MKRSALMVCICLSVMAAPAPLDAHHAFAAEFDRDKPITLTGAVTKLE